MTKQLFNYPTKSENCANCKRAKKGHWKLGLYFCSCDKGVKLDSSNQEHYNVCPYFKKKEVK